MKKFILSIFAIVFFLHFEAQNPGFAINHDGSAPHPNALLELEWGAVPQGFLAPRMAEANIPTSPVDGLVIYITDGDFPGFYQYISGDWKPLRHNNFKGYIDIAGLAGLGTTTGASGSIVETDGSNLIFTTVNTGVVEVDMSAYTLTDPVVQATGKFIIADDPEPCNGIWAAGIVDQNHLHKLVLTPLVGGGGPIIHFETDETDLLFGLIVDPIMGIERSFGYDFTTPLNNPPGRYTYYQNGLDGNLIPITNWALDNANPANWPGDDQFPIVGSSAWTDLGVDEVYTQTPLIAGENYAIEVQPYHDPHTEVTTGQPFYSTIGIYVDFNKDGDFDDAGEVIAFLDQDPPANDGAWQTSQVVNLPVPTSAINGKARMRIVVQRSGNFGGVGQTGINPDLAEACLTNFADTYAGHTYEFDLVIDGGQPPYLYEGTFCNVSDVSNTSFTVRCYTQNGLPVDGEFDFNVYDKF